MNNSKEIRLGDSVATDCSAASARKRRLFCRGCGEAASIGIPYGMPKEIGVYYHVCQATGVVVELRGKVEAIETYLAIRQAAV